VLPLHAYARLHCPVKRTGGKENLWHLLAGCLIAAAMNLVILVEGLLYNLYYS